ncbi:MAG: hypothetical protein K6G90_14830 [Clostridia bacterium]|nr:hypothetical protein [Clostridia bacterium]
MLEELQEIYEDTLGVHDYTLSPKDKINNIPGLTSIGMINLICAIEDHFDIEISNKQLTSFKTVKDIADFLEKRRQQ